MYPGYREQHPCLVFTGRGGALRDDNLPMQRLESIVELLKCGTGETGMNGNGSHPNHEKL